MSQRALIVDDNLPLAEDLAEILTDEGYEVRVCGRPREALLACRDERFDVVLLDIRMPDMDGVELQQSLAQRCPEARFVLMTAYTEDERISAAMSAGVRVVLTKPIPIPRLLKVLACDDEDGGAR